MQITVAVFALLVAMDAVIGTRILKLPLIACTITGALTGNTTMGVIVGSTLQAFYYVYDLDGSDMSIYGVLATYLVVTGNLSVDSVSYTVGITCVVGLSILSSVIGSLFLSPARKAIETQNIKKIGVYNLLSLLLRGILAFVFTFAVLGQKEPLNFLDVLNTSYGWIFNGMVMAGFMLRGLGIAVVLRNLRVNNFIPSLLAGAALGMVSLGVKSYMMIPCVLTGIALAVYTFKAESRPAETSNASTSAKKGAEKWW